MKAEQITNSHLTRRRLLGIGVGALGSAISAACRIVRMEGSTLVSMNRQLTGSIETADEGRLLARPAQPLDARGAAPLGLQRLRLDGPRDALLYVPAGYKAERPAPLAVMLHGAGGNAQHGMALLRHYADTNNLILLAPDSRGQTWDVIVKKYGPDVTFIDRALAQTFDCYAVDAAHIAIGGFSDGASYALSLGITNGDLFTHVIAFSPGFIRPAERRGAPRLFISHGTRDEVLPINVCSRSIVPQVRRAGYDVRYQEFAGPHTVPPEIARAAVDWLRTERTSPKAANEL